MMNEDSVSMGDGWELIIFIDVSGFGVMVDIVFVFEM